MKDPVCGMDVSPDAAAGTAVRDGQVYYFCSEPSQARFSANAATLQADGPRVVSGPAKDPICGMVVEKATALLYAVDGLMTRQFTAPAPEPSTPRFTYQPALPATVGMADPSSGGVTFTIRARVAG